MIPDSIWSDSELSQESDVGFSPTSLPQAEDVLLAVSLSIISREQLSKMLEDIEAVEDRHVFLKQAAEHLERVWLSETICLEQEPQSKTWEDLRRTQQYQSELTEQLESVQEIQLKLMNELASWNVNRRTHLS